jgi:hypothetical protein
VTFGFAVPAAGFGVADELFLGAQPGLEAGTGISWNDLPQELGCGSVVTCWRRLRSGTQVPTAVAVYRWARGPVSRSAGVACSGRWPRSPPWRQWSSAGSPPDERGDVPAVRSQLASLRSGQLWLLLGATVLVTGGYMGAFSYISPVLTEGAGLSVSSVRLP